MQVRPIECIRRSRESNPEVLQDNISLITRLSNKVSAIRTRFPPRLASLAHSDNEITNWVSESILQEEDPRKRAVIVKHLITVARVGFF